MTIILISFKKFGYRFYIYNVTDLFKAFRDNGSINTFQRATMKDVSQWTNVIAPC
jgi:hypothetical protein